MTSTSFKKGGGKLAGDDSITRSKEGILIACQPALLSLPFGDKTVSWLTIFLTTRQVGQQSRNKLGRLLACPTEWIPTCLPTVAHGYVGANACFLRRHEDAFTKTWEINTIPTAAWQEGRHRRGPSESRCSDYLVNWVHSAEKNKNKTHGWASQPRDERERMLSTCKILPLLFFSTAPIAVVKY